MVSGKKDNGLILLPKDFDKALMGVAFQFTNSIAVYDRDKVIEIYEKQGMTADEAKEFFEFNCQGAWHGERTPAFLWFMNRKQIVEAQEEGWL